MDSFKDCIYTNNFNVLIMKKWTSVRAVYLLMSIVLFTATIYSQWQLVLFVAIMLQLGVWTKFCPSKWLFEKIGFKKTNL